MSCSWCNGNLGCESDDSKQWLHAVCQFSRACLRSGVPKVLNESLDQSSSGLAQWQVRDITVTRYQRLERDSLFDLAFMIQSNSTSDVRVFESECSIARGGPRRASGRGKEHVYFNVQ